MECALDFPKGCKISKPSLNTSNNVGMVLVKQSQKLSQILYFHIFTIFYYGEMRK